MHPGPIDCTHLGCGADGTELKPDCSRDSDYLLLEEEAYGVLKKAFGSLQDLSRVVQNRGSEEVPILYIDINPVRVSLSIVNQNLGTTVRGKSNIISTSSFKKQIIVQ